MKYRFASVAAVFFSALVIGCEQQGGVVPVAQPIPAAPARDLGPAAFFYDRLARAGEWIDTPEYGLCWYPADVGPSWRPYTNGRWVYTIGSGWLWVGAEKWGWATDHYGQWVFLDSHGWAWAPGKQWSPAWVVWRAGNGYVGWAPMPPAKLGQRELDVTRVDSKTVPPLAFTFVPEKFLADEKLATHLEPLTRNITLLEMTEDATRYQMSDGRIFDGGVSVETINKAAGEAVTQFHVVEVINLRVPEVRGEDVMVYRPNLDNAAEAILAGMTSAGPPQPPPQPRDPRPELLSAQRERLVDYHRQLRQQMEQRHQGERSSATTQPDLEERQQREVVAFEDERQREIEALRRRQLDERERFAAAHPPPPQLEQSDPQATQAQQAKHYEIPPEWQLPPQMMPPPKPSPRR